MSLPYAMPSFPPFLPALSLAVVRRRAELGLTQDLTARGGPSDSVVQRIEKGNLGPRGPRALTLQMLDVALEWPAGTAHALLVGSKLPEQPAPPVTFRVVGVRVILASGTEDYVADDVRKAIVGEGVGLEFLREGRVIAEAAPHTWVAYEMLCEPIEPAADAATGE